MQAAVTIPDPLFQAAEDIARAAGLSRDELFAEALSEYVARRRLPLSDDEITARLDAVYAETDPSLDEFVREVQARSLPRGDW